MDFLEKDLERIIFETENELLNKKGLPIVGRKKRQVKIGNYGIADLVSYQILSKSYIEVEIYELKLKTIGVSAVLQIIGYAKGVKRFFEKKYPNKVIYVSMVLIGKDIDTSGSVCYIENFIDEMSFYTYRYDIDGVMFKNESGFALTNEGF